jgi:hypothetical protein
MLVRIAPEYGAQVPFQRVLLSEYLVGYLEANVQRIEVLNFDLAYQRPCASRQTSEKGHFLDELFELTGVRQVERTYDRQEAVCCRGAKFFLGMEDPKPDQQKNILDAKWAGAEAVVRPCSMCVQLLAEVAAEQGMPLIFLGDLARMALGELASPFQVGQ